MGFSTSEVIADTVWVVVDTSSLTCSYINYGTARAVLKSVQLTALNSVYTQEWVVSTMRQSATRSFVENAIYTTTVEVTHSC